MTSTPRRRLLAGPLVAIFAAVGFFGAGGGYARQRRRAQAPAPAPPPVAAAAPEAPQAPTIVRDGTAPACVGEGAIHHARTAGPGVAIVACEGKAFQCVITVVKDQVGFNCAEFKPSPEAPQEEPDIVL